MIKHIILDRDGCINKHNPTSKYVSKVEDFNLFEDVVPFFKHMSLNLEVRFSVVTNQQGIGLGIYELNDVSQMHELFLQNVGIKVEDFPLFVCPHLEGTCHCRKPSPTLLNQAIEASGIEKKATIFVGDAESDYQAAQAAGIPFVFLDRAGRFEQYTSSRVKSLNELSIMLDKCL